MRALVIEDEPSIRELVRKLMAPFGKCDGAPNGPTGIAVLRQALEGGSGYDVILLDLMMPGMDGFEVLEQLRTLERQHGVAADLAAKVVIMTARDSSHVIQQLQTAPCQGYLLKPFSRRELLDELASLGFSA